MTFKDAVSEAPAPVAAAFRPGLQALGADSHVLSCDDTRRLTGSIDLDASLAESCPEAPRWDYGIGVRAGSLERAVWLEVHTATTTEVGRVLAKLAWLKKWLKENAPALEHLTKRGSPAFFWAATEAGVHIYSGTPQARQLRLAGLDLPRRVLKVS